MDFNGMADIIQKGGTVTLLCFFIVGGYTRKWVFGWMYDDVVKERDQWKALALQNVQMLDKATNKA